MSMHTLCLLRRAILGVGLLVSLSNAAGENGGLLWSSTGGGWRSMAANSAYAQIFARIGLFDKADSPAKASFDAVSTNSGSSWFSAQFFFSEAYYSAIVDSTPSELGEFTRSWFKAYAATQANITSDCGPLQQICDMAGQFPPGNFVSDIAALLPLINHFNFSWPNFIYDMFKSCSETFGDKNFIDTKASSSSKVPQLLETDVHFHTSLLPNMRARSANTITYLGRDNGFPNTSYTIPLPRDWSVRNKQGDRWYAGNAPHAIPGGLVYPAPAQFVGSTAYENFPVYPPSPSDGIFTTPAGNASGDIKADEMAPPFGGIPTAVQISAASSTNMGYISEALPSYFAQFFSLQSFGVENSDRDDAAKASLLATIEEIQELFWRTGIMANTATCSAWKDPDPRDMPECLENNVFFTDGGYTDGPSAALTIAQYQDTNGIEGEIKIVISNNNYYTNNMNNILQYFSTSWNEGVQPGDFIWAPGVGSNPVKNPWMSQQIFREYQDEESVRAALEPIEGTNLTMAILNGTTIDNPTFGITSGQKVSIALLNINSDIPTILVSEPVIKAYTPTLVDLVQAIAGSGELAARLRTFVGIESDGDEVPSSGRGIISDLGPTFLVAAVCVLVAQLL